MSTPEDHTHERTADGISMDDPRLTAYALDADFLSSMGPNEAAAFERRLASSPEARAEVEALRGLGSELVRGIADVPRGEGLDAARKATVLAPPEEHAATPRRGRPLAFWGYAAAAACLLCGVAIFQAWSLPGTQSANHAETNMHVAGGGEPALDGRAGSVTPPALQGAADSEAWSPLFPEPVSGNEPVPQTAPGKSPVRLAGSNPDLRTGAAPALELHGPTGAPAMPGAQYGGAGGALPPARVGYISTGRPTFGVPVTQVRLDQVTNGVDSYTGGMNRAGTTLSLRYKGWYPGGHWGGYNVQLHGEQYVHPGIDTFMHVTKRGGHTSTFSIDVDSASYSNVRRMLNAGQRPHPAAVRIEEFINYFDYGYSAPAADSKQPFAQHMQVAACPWNSKHRLVRIALKGKEIQRKARPTSNLVFLVDVSGSMRDEDKLPLLQSGLEMLVENLDARDRVSIVTYASTATLALESTHGDQRAELLAKIRSLKAGGGTNGAGGIQLAYAEAQKHFQKESVNRVILCTDGDFNVGVADGPGLTKLVQEKAKGGVYLSVLGFGTGNLQDGKMEAYSNAGNGNYAYLDSLAEARRVLVEQMEGTLITIAKDVKFQVWFNPKTVHAWRLLGYENRRLAAKDFNDDSKDAGDIGAGHEVTALYELVPTGVGLPNQVDSNPFVTGAPKPKDGLAKGASAKGGAAPKAAKDEPQPQEDALLIWRLRWKQPDGTTSALVERNVFDQGLGFEQADRDFQWAAGVTAFGMLLRHSPHRGQASYALVEELTGAAKGEDPKGRRAEFLGLVAKAQGK